MEASMIVGIVLLQENVSEYHDIHLKNLQLEQKKASKTYLGLNYKKNKKKMKVIVIIEKGKDNRFSAIMDYYELDFGLAGFGKTVEEAIKDFYECYEEEKKMCTNEGKDCPELEFDIRYDMTSFLDYYANMLSKPALEKITGINQKQLWRYSSGKRRLKPETTIKIQQRIHQFADNLKQVQFI